MCLLNGSTKILSKFRNTLCTRQHSMTERALAFGDRQTQLAIWFQSRLNFVSLSFFLCKNGVQKTEFRGLGITCADTVLTHSRHPIYVSNHYVTSLFLLKKTSKVKNLNKDQVTKKQVYKSIKVVEIFSFLSLFMKDSYRVFSQVRPETDRPGGMHEADGHLNHTNITMLYRDSLTSYLKFLSTMTSVIPIDSKSGFKW